MAVIKYYSNAGKFSFQNSWCSDSGRGWDAIRQIKLTKFHPPDASHHHMWLKVYHWTSILYHKKKTFKEVKRQAFQRTFFSISSSENRFNICSRQVLLRLEYYACLNRCAVSKLSLSYYFLTILEYPAFLRKRKVEECGNKQLVNINKPCKKVSSKFTPMLAKNIFYT